MDELSAAQAAALTGFSERTIRRKIASGELPARRIAPNRFAIDVRDLPRRKEVHDLMSRLAALERRVTQLEDGERALPLSLVRNMVDPGDLGDLGDLGAALMSGEESAAASGVLSQLLVQLLREVDRLGPLLTPGAQSEPSEGRQHRDARQRAASRWLPSPSEDTAG